MPGSNLISQELGKHVSKTRFFTKKYINRNRAIKVFQEHVLSLCHYDGCQEVFLLSELALSTYCCTYMTPSGNGHEVSKCLLVTYLPLREATSHHSFNALQNHLLRLN